ncbi:LuxR C-terminal-related transcriptional regulator [Burkholderia sp. 4M9327F10]
MRIRSRKSLTRREQDVVDLIFAGLLDKQIAWKLPISARPP